MYVPRRVIIFLSWLSDYSKKKFVVGSAKRKMKVVAEQNRANGEYFTPKNILAFGSANREILFLAEQTPIE